MFDTYDISGSALTAQRARLDVIAGNLANVNSTRKADGTIGAYHRRNVVFATMLDQAKQQQSHHGFASSVPFGSPQSGDANSRWIKPMSSGSSNGSPYFKLSANETRTDAVAQGVKITQIVEDDKTPERVVFDPSHPDADEQGYVHLPNINPVAEMVDMIAASRAYEANVNAITTAKGMGQAALEI